MKPTSISFKKILSHSKLIYTDTISLLSVELNWFILDEDLACNKVQKVLTAGGSCGGAPGEGELWLVDNLSSYFHHTLGHSSSAHLLREGVVRYNPDVTWRCHIRIHCTYFSFYFEHLRVTEWESVAFSMLHPFNTVRLWTLQWRCHSCDTSNMY